MSDGRAGERSVSAHIPSLVGLFVLLFFFSVLDPVTLIAVHVCSLLFFFTTRAALRGIGLFGLTVFFYLIVRAGEISPAPAAVLVSGLAFGSVLRLRRFRTAFYPSLLSAVIALILVSGAFLLVNRDGLVGWIGEVHDLFLDALETSFVRLQKTGAFGIEELVQFKSALNGIADWMVSLIPAAACLNMLLAGVIAVDLFHLLPVGDDLLPRTRELEHFSFDDSFVWGLILGLLSVILPLPQTVRTVLLNVFALIFLFYLLRGMAVGVFWLRKRGLSTFAIVAVYAFLFALLPPLFILSLLLPGVLDTWFDFRSPGEVVKGP